MEPVLDEERRLQLTGSLVKDQHVDTLQQVEEAYQSALVKAQHTAGYPHLYRRAWQMLVSALRSQQWHLLNDIDRIFSLVFPGDGGEEMLRENMLSSQQQHQQISMWHLKAVLYAWSRLPPAGGGGGGMNASTVHLNTHQQAEALLSQASAANAFTNMSPQEAQIKLLQASVNDDTVQPFLFRLSTTEPGTISLSFLTPVSNKVAHQRVRNIQAFMEDQEDGSVDIYRIMIGEFLGGSGGGGGNTNGMLSSTDLLIMMRKLDPHADARLLQQKLATVHQSVERHHVYATLRRLFFPHLRARQLVPQSEADRAGLTDSYRDSYVSLSSLVVPLGTADGNVTVTTTLYCFNAECGSTELTHKEVLSNRLYCSDEWCPLMDYVNCY